MVNITIRDEVDRMYQSIKALGSIVRKSRKDKHLSQEALAERIGVCKRTIIDIENSTGNPKFEILCKLVRELELPIYQIFYPEVPENEEIQKMLVEEIKTCTVSEMKIILSVIKGLRYELRDGDFG